MIYIINRKVCIKTRSTPALFPPVTVKWSIERVIKNWSMPRQLYRQIIVHVKTLSFLGESPERLSEDMYHGTSRESPPSKLLQVLLGSRCRECKTLPATSVCKACRCSDKRTEIVSSRNFK